MTDGEILAQLSALIEQERPTLVAILQHLAEVERRGLHLSKGYSSLFAYCVQRLKFSEDVAYKRVGASRYGQRFPLVLEFIGAGTLHLSALMLIGPHLTETNHRDWLSAAAGKSKREVEALVASRCPKPDVPSSIRKLPKQRELVSAMDSSAPSISLRIGGLATGAASRSIDAHVAASDPASPKCDVYPVASTATVHSSSAVTATDCLSSVVIATLPSSSAVTATDCLSSVVIATLPSSSAATATSSIAHEKRPNGESSKAAERPRVQPLSSSSYRIVFTATEVFKQKLDRAQELCSHSVAPGDFPLLLERALDRLIQQEQKRRCAIASPKIQPRAAIDSPLDGAVGESAGTTAPIDLGHGRARTDGAPDGIAASDAAGNAAGNAKRARQGKGQDPDPVEPSPELSRPELETLRPEVRTVVEVPWPFSSPRPGTEPFEFNAVPESSRHVPAAVRRAVWERDGGQCSFVDEDGHRCNERRFLEIDHVVAYARGGPTTTDNCRLLCRAHNQHWARLTFGAEFLERACSRQHAV